TKRGGERDWKGEARWPEVERERVQQDELRRDEAEPDRDRRQRSRGHRAPAGSAGPRVDRQHREADAEREREHESRKENAVPVGQVGATTENRAQRDGVEEERAVVRGGCLFDR